MKTHKHSLSCLARHKKGRHLGQLYCTVTGESLRVMVPTRSYEAFARREAHGDVRAIMRNTPSNRAEADRKLRVIADLRSEAARHPGKRGEFANYERLNRAYEALSKKYWSLPLTPHSPRMPD